MSKFDKTRISKHRKGLLINNPQDKTGASLSGALLRQTLGAPMVTIPKQGFLIAEDYAEVVLDQFGTTDVEWDPTALELALKQAQDRELQLRAQVEVEYAIENAHLLLESYPLTNKLDPHQVEAVSAIVAPSLRGIAIFDEQGTGKTVMALCGYDLLRQEKRVNYMLVIAPKSVIGSWKSNAEMLFGNKYVVSIVSGQSKHRRQIMLHSHDILVVNYETVVRDLNLLRAILSTRSYQYLLTVDESFYVKNPNAQRTNAVVELRKYCERAVILCGTPAPNSPHDLVQQINIADQGVAFGQHHIPKDRDEAHVFIASYLQGAIYLRRLKRDVLPDIPEKQIDCITFELQPHQQVMYQQACDELVLAVRSVDDEQFARQLTSFLARRSALLQICSHPGALNPLYDETPAKHLVLDQLLRQLIEENGEKVVVWSYYRHSLQALAERYAYYGLVRIDGSVTSTDARIEAIRRFQRDPEIRIFLGNAAAAGAGITLTASHHAIYESLSNQAAHYMQSVDRIHRRGQTEDVVIHVLLGRDTIEEREFERTLEKERSSRDLLGDIYEEPITRERFLADLGATVN